MIYSASPPRPETNELSSRYDANTESELVPKFARTEPISSASTRTGFAQIIGARIRDFVEGGRRGLGPMRSGASDVLNFSSESSRVRDMGAHFTQRISENGEGITTRTEANRYADSMRRDEGRVTVSIADQSKASVFTARFPAFSRSMDRVVSNAQRIAEDFGTSPRRVVSTIAAGERSAPPGSTTHFPKLPAARLNATALEWVSNLLRNAMERTGSVANHTVEQVTQGVSGATTRTMDPNKPQVCDLPPVNRLFGLPITLDFLKLFGDTQPPVSPQPIEGIVSNRVNIARAASVTVVTPETRTNDAPPKRATQPPLQLANVFFSWSTLLDLMASMQSRTTALFQSARGEASAPIVGDVRFKPNASTPLVNNGAKLESGERFPIAMSNKISETKSAGVRAGIETEKSGRSEQRKNSNIAEDRTTSSAVTVDKFSKSASAPVGVSASHSLDFVNNETQSGTPIAMSNTVCCKLPVSRDFSFDIASASYDLREKSAHSWEVTVSYSRQFGQAVDVHIVGAVEGIVIAFDSSCAAAREALSKTAKRAATALENMTRKRVRVLAPDRNRRDHAQEEARS